VVLTTVGLRLCNAERGGEADLILAGTINSRIGTEEHLTLAFSKNWVPLLQCTLLLFLILENAQPTLLHRKLFQMTSKSGLKASMHFLAFQVYVGVALEIP
jgi:hypothetical protein